MTDSSGIDVHNETIIDAARREAHEEVCVALGDGTYFASTQDDDETQSHEQCVALHAVAFDVTGQELAPRALAARALRWVTLQEIDSLQWPRGNAVIFSAFRKWLEHARVG